MICCVGFEYCDGEEVIECMCGIKIEYELCVMCCVIYFCECLMVVMEDFVCIEILKGGVIEDDVWVVFYVENIKCGGEWIEIWLFILGLCMNLWFQECGLWVIVENEIFVFDIDLIGFYGICVDFSCIWWIGDDLVLVYMCESYVEVVEYICYNMVFL